MIAKRLLVGLVALCAMVLAVVAVDAPSQVRAQQQPPFFVPHGDYASSTDTCRVCHAWHPDGGNGLFPGDQLLRVPNQPGATQPNELDVCFACHDGSAAETNVQADLTEETRASTHPVLAPRNERALACSDCHAEHQSPEEDIKLLYRETTPGTYVFSPPGNPIGDTFCFGCHGSASTLPAPFGDKGLFETSIHATSSLVRPPTPGTGLKCSACHEPHASDYTYLTRANEEELCFTCHTIADPNTANGSNPEDAFTAVANDLTDDGNGIRIYHHPVAEGEQANGTRTVECASCHNSHLVDRTETASDPARARTMDSGWRFEWDADSGSYARSPNAADYCGTCHASPTTTSPLASSAVVPYDVNLVNDTGDDADGRPHDQFDLTWFLTGADSAHGNPGFTPSDYLGCPPGEPCELACTACHDFHGSSNAYMLREDIASPDYRPLTVSNATWVAGQEALPGIATLTIGTHGIGKDWYVVVAGVSPPEYNGTFQITDVLPGQISYELPLATPPGLYGGGGTVDPRGVDATRSYTSTMVDFGGLDTSSDQSKLQTFCLTCHLEQSSSHQSGELCTGCHNHSPSSSREF